MEKVKFYVKYSLFKFSFPSPILIAITRKRAKLILLFTNREKSIEVFLSESETQTVSSRIWTRVADFIYYDDNS